MSDTILQALLDRWEVPFRNRTAYNALAKLQPFAVAGFKLDPNIAELAVATRLLFVAALHLNLFADGFTVRHARLLQCDLWTDGSYFYRRFALMGKKKACYDKYRQLCWFWRPAQLPYFLPKFNIEKISF